MFVMRCKTPPKDTRPVLRTHEEVESCSLIPTETISKTYRYYLKLMKELKKEYPADSELIPIALLRFRKPYLFSYLSFQPICSQLDIDGIVRDIALGILKTPLVAIIDITTFSIHYYEDHRLVIL